jgi:ProP effector
VINIPQISQPDKPPPTPSLRESRRQAAAAAIALLAELYPNCFSIYEERRRPLKLEIHLDIQTALGSSITLAEVHNALGSYCSNQAYLSHLRKGAPRLDLNGERAGAVTADEAAHGREMLAHIRTKQKNRAAAAKAQAKAVAPPIKRLSLSDLKAAALARKTGAAINPQKINMESHRRQ